VEEVVPRLVKSGVTAGGMEYPASGKGETGKRIKTAANQNYGLPCM